MNSRNLNFTSNPFLRFALPLGLGIALYDYAASFSLIIGIIAILLFAVSRFKKNRNFTDFSFKFAFFLVFVLIGFATMSIDQPKTLPDKSLNTVRSFTLDIEEINQRNNSTELIGNATIDQQQIKVMVSHKGSIYTLREGDRLMCKSRVEKIPGNDLPDTFDYSEYLRRQKGIIYRCYVTPQQCMLVDHNDNFKTLLSRFRHTVTQAIIRSSLSEDASYLAITFFTGNRSYLSDIDRERFSMSGLAHILAVSGLHIGIIIAIVSVILRPFRRYNFRGKRFATIIPIIWMYVIFTGMSASAVRAAIMATFYFGAKDMHLKHSSINSLAAAAFFILLFSPNSLYDVGFQLSILSVTGILLLSRRLQIHTKYSWLNKLWTPISITCAAQLFTAPLIIYYFHSFPTGFFISNVIVLPLLPILICLMLVVVLLAAFSIQSWILTDATEGLYNLIADLCQYLSNIIPPIDDLYIDSFTVLLLILTVLSFGIIISARINKKLFIIPANLLLLAVATCIYNKATEKDYGTFICYDYNATYIVTYCHNHAYIYNSRTDSIIGSEFALHNSDFFKRRNINEYSYSTNNIIWGYDGKKYAFIGSRMLRRYSKDNPLTVDVAIISSRFYKDLKSIDGIVIADSIVLPRELPVERYDELKNALQLLKSE